MPNIQYQIDNLRKKIGNYRALRDDLGDTAEQKIAELEQELEALIQAQRNPQMFEHNVTITGDVTGSIIVLGDGNTITNITGTVTFLFTDIESSTQLWEKHPATAKLALARHDIILRQAIESHNGHIFKTLGDAFYSVFTSAPDALLAAIEAQQALHAENWDTAIIKVRMGLHSGTVETRAKEFVGPPLNRVAILMAAGHGEQVLLSTITTELVRPSLPPNITLRDMGECRLKDLIRPEHIYQLVIPGLPAVFPPLKTLESIQTNLPTQMTSFVGREKEILATKTLVTANRLTTLIGPGGVGKTRISLQVAANLLDFFSGGVWFVELAPLTNPALIAPTIANAIGLREDATRSLLDLLTDYLRSKITLLLLDNCEHLIEAAAQFVTDLLKNCPHLQLLISSREALGIPGEMVYRIPSLSIPHPMVAYSAADLATFESVQLFVERAQAVTSEFTISSENVSAVAQICSRLDGIPLAIELAAARVKMLRVEQIAERLDDRFHLLTGGSRTVLPRHQTLRAMIDWSYDLLPNAERALLRRLSVFANGWTFEAAETICQGTSIDDYNILDPLTQLVNKSLVAVDVDKTSETRYYLLKTVRQYAREKLSEASEGMAIRDIHLQYYLGLAERAEPELVGPRVVEWSYRIEVELDNINAALEWSLKRDAQIGLRLIASLFHFWVRGGHGRTAYKWLKLLLDRPESQLPTITRARALGVLGFFLTFDHFDDNVRFLLEENLELCRKLDYKQGIAWSILCFGLFTFDHGNPILGRQMVTKSLTLYRELNDKLSIAYTLSFLGGSVDAKNYKRAHAYLDEALNICHEIGYLSGIGHNLSDLGNLAIQYGNYSEAHKLLEEGLAIQRQFQKSGNLIFTLTHLGELAARTGDGAKARTYYEEALSLIHKAGGEPKDDRWLLVKLGYAAMWQNDKKQALELLKQGTKLFREVKEKIGVVYALEGLANIAISQEQFACAAQIFGWADSVRKAIDNARPPIEQADVDHALAAIHAQLTEAEFSAASAAGCIMTTDEVIAIAIALKIEDDPPSTTNWFR